MQRLHRFSLCVLTALLVAPSAVAQMTGDMWDWHGRMHDGWGFG